ncbi:MAG: sugar phosphate nucleotidyltransferase, partial [bacterium]
MIQVDDAGRIVGFQEKPANPAPIPGDPSMCLVSMGNYLFRSEVLVEALQEDAVAPGSSHDFGKDIIPKAVKAGKAAAHPFELSCVGRRLGAEPYWRDVGTIDAYWDANIDLTATDP